GRIPACVSVHDPFGQAGSGQRQRRFRHRNLTGRPPTARSRTSVSRRPLETARTPHSGHPTTSVVVSTSIHTSPSTSTLASTRNPRMPNRTAAGSIPSTMTYGLLSQRLVATTKRSEAMGHITVFPDSPDAPSPPTRREEPLSRWSSVAIFFLFPRDRSLCFRPEIPGTTDGVDGAIRGEHGSSL